MALWIAWSGAAWAEEPLPTATQLLPDANQFLPGFKRPWEIGIKYPRYRTEADWKKDNAEYAPQGLQQLRQIAAAYRRMPDRVFGEQLAQIRKMKRRMRQAGLGIDFQLIDLIAPFTGGHIPSPLDRVSASFWPADADRKTIVRMLEAEVLALQDANRMLYTKIDRPERIESPDDAKALLEMEVVVRIFRRSYWKNQSDRIDFDAGRLSSATGQLRTVLQQLLRLEVNRAADKFEREYYDTLETVRRDDRQRRLQEIVDKLNYLAKASFEIQQVYSPPIGDAAHVVIVEAPGDLDRARPLTKAVAQVRVGRAVFLVNASAAGPYRKTVRQDLEQSLKLLARRAAAYRLESQ